MKKTNNFNNFKNSNISRNDLNSKNNKPLIKEEKYVQTTKPLPIKKNQKKYQASNINRISNDIIEYIPCVPLYDNYIHNPNYINNNQHLFNNNFIIETSYGKNKPKISYKNNNNYKINIINNNQNINCSKYSNTEEQSLLFSKINKINEFGSVDKNNHNIFFSYQKANCLNNSDDNENDNDNDIQMSDVINCKYRSSINKKKISSYILKDKYNDSNFYINNNTSPLNFSSIKNKNKSNPKIIHDNYITNINNSYKNISSRIIKRQPLKTLSELLNEEKQSLVFINYNNRKKNKNVKQRLLLIDKSYNFIYDNKSKKSKLKRNYNSSSNIRERRETDKHSGGKIILSLNENTIKRK